ncbi:hypothetical protein YT1_1600 [Rhodococcus ruber]|nr:hypothetical protein YT1_1600 [Rhodococcus ruber]
MPSRLEKGCQVIAVINRAAIGADRPDRLLRTSPSGRP